MRKELNSQRITLVHQHGRRFIVLEHQYGRRDDVKTLYSTHRSRKFVFKCSRNFWLSLLRVSKTVFFSNQSITS